MQLLFDKIFQSAEPVNGPRRTSRRIVGCFAPLQCAEQSRRTTPTVSHATSVHNLNRGIA
jgi:hypothetical protein